MTNYLPALAIAALYICATWMLINRLRQPMTGTTGAFEGKRPALLLAAIAAGLHCLVAFQHSGLPDALSLPFFTALSVTMLTIVIIQLIMCITRPADYLGLLIYPIAAVSILSSELVQSPVKPVAQSLQLHILLSITAYAVLALGAAQAVLVAVQRRYLNKRQPGGFIRALPALTSTESLLFSLLGVGFALLTLSLVSGFAFLEDMFAQQVVHKTVLSCLAWVIFAVLLFGRWRFGWRGQRVVRWTLGGFATLLVAYFGSKMVLELILPAHCLLFCCCWCLHLRFSLVLKRPTATRPHYEPPNYSTIPSASLA